MPICWGMNEMIPLPSRFTDRAALLAHIRALAGDSAADMPVPDIAAGGRRAAETALAAIDPRAYAASRNHLDGAVTRLSPYIRHGVLCLDEVRNAALASAGNARQAEKFIQELAWRDYWQRVYLAHPERIWADVESYKTGFDASEYDPDLPADIAAGETGVACIDQFVATLVDTGYLHNHARMYLAAYIVHWRRVCWQAGARFFLDHLIDGDPASNNLSWQWIASTFSNKPYIFNLENVAKYCGPDINIIPRHNLVLDQSYDRLNELLFPNLGGIHG